MSSVDNIELAAICEPSAKGMYEDGTMSIGSMQVMSLKHHAKTLNHKFNPKRGGSMGK